MAEDTKEQLLRYLNDSYAAEVGGMASMKDLANLATDTDLKQAIEKHIALTQSHADRVTARILALGGDKSEPKGILNETLAKASGLINVFHSHEDKQTQDTIKVYSYGHFKIGAYTSLKAFASSISDQETAGLAETIISEEKVEADHLLRVIPQLAVASLSNTA